MFYQCRYFKIEELVDPITFRNLGSRCWILFRPEALIALDDLREYFGSPIIVNNWESGGVLEYRGFRPKDCTIGAIYSQHRLGNAFDCNVTFVSTNEARNEILRNKDHDLFKRITAIEKGVGWLHFDLRNIPDEERIFLISPEG